VITTSWVRAKSKYLLWLALKTLLLTTTIFCNVYSANICIFKISTKMVHIFLLFFCNLRSLRKTILPTWAYHPRVLLRCISPTRPLPSGSIGRIAVDSLLAGFANWGAGRCGLEWRKGSVGPRGDFKKVPGRNSTQHITPDLIGHLWTSD